VDRDTRVLAFDLVLETGLYVLVLLVPGLASAGGQQLVTGPLLQLPEHHQLLLQLQNLPDIVT